MSQAPWQFDKHQALLALGELSGVVNLLAPAEGVQLRWRGAAVVALAVDLPSIAESQAASMLDAWIRDDDLVATYAQSDDRHTRGQVYWRAHQYEHGGETFPAIDLVTSVQTSLLESDPALNVRSCISAREVLRLIGEETSRIEPAAGQVSEPLRISAPRDSACFIFRLADGQSSYLEMVHPSDFNESVLRPLGNGQIELTNRLFQGRLEKGVILRSRVRALFVPTGKDAVLAGACYADFAASEPLLTV